MDPIYLSVVVFLMFLAISDLVVGVSNDAVNFLNSAVGAKSARFRTIIILAALGVFVGAAFSNGMMDIARHGIFQPEYFTFSELICIMLAVMVTDVLLLDTFNSMGMPTSTTVSLVFELLGGTVALAMIKNIASDGALTFAQMLNTDKALSVVLGIFLSIAIAFFFGAVVQYIARIIFTFNYKRNLKWFAGIFGGIATTAIIYFMIIKGMKDASFMTPENSLWVKENTNMLMLGCFIVSGVLMQVLHWCRVNIFKIIVLIGTMALAMAFAGNDLVNFIGVPLAGLSAYQDYAANAIPAGIPADSFYMDSLNGPAHTPVLYLLAAGTVMVLTLVTSKKAKNVIKTSVNLSRQDSTDEMFGSSAIARRLVLVSTSIANWFLKVTPEKMRNWIDSRFNKDEIILENGAAFDQLRAAVNLVIAALLIAFGTSLKLPLSTTFVTFMVAMGSSLADRAWNRESAVFRVTGVVSVIGGWFITAGVAFMLCFIITLIMYYGGFAAMAVFAAVALFLIIRSNIKYGKKAKKEKDDSIFARILASEDKAEIWSLLKQHVEENIFHQVEYTKDFYNRFIEDFIGENRKDIRKLYNSLHNESQMNKVIRRKEALALKQTDTIISLQAGTWFHLTTNNTAQLLYGLKRMIEPSKEHFENNFNPLPAECAQELRPVAKAMSDILEEAAGYVSDIKSGKNDALAPLIKEISAFKKDVAKVRENNLVRFRGEKTSENLNIYILYQTVLQETQQLADTLKHLTRAYTSLNAIK